MVPAVGHRPGAGLWKTAALLSVVLSGVSDCRVISAQSPAAVPSDAPGTRHGHRVAQVLRKNLEYAAALQEQRRGYREGDSRKTELEKARSLPITCAGSRKHLYLYMLLGYSILDVGPEEMGRISVRLMRAQGPLTLPEEFDTSSGFLTRGEFRLFLVVRPWRQVTDPFNLLGEGGADRLAEELLSPLDLETYKSLLDQDQLAFIDIGP